MSSAVSFAGLQGERIGDIGESHEAFQFVIAVVAAAQHAQSQIDLGGSLFDQRCAHEGILTPVAGLLARLGLRRGFLRQPVLQLGLDLGQVVRHRA